MGDCQLFFEQLLLEQIRVIAVPGEQLIVRAQLHDAAGHQHGNLVRMADGGDAVGDEQGSAALHHALQFAQDLLLGIGVDAGQSVVEDQDAGVADDGAGNRGALFLAAGKGDAALADGGGQAGGEFFKFAANVRRFGGLKNLAIGSPGSAKSDISADGLAE